MSEEKELPTGWVRTTLGEVFEWGSGGTPQSTNEDYYGGAIPWLIIGDLNDSTVTASQNTLTEAGLNNSSAKWVEPGSVLLAMYGASIGKLGIAGIPLTTNQAIAFTNPYPVGSRFLFYYLLGQKGELINLGKGAAQRNISQTVIKSFPFILAPLAEQQRIVAAIEQQFTRLDAGVAALKSAQARLKRYRAAVLKAAVEGKLTEAWRAEHPDAQPASALLQRILAERRARWEADLRAKGKDPTKARYEEPGGPDTTDLPELPEEWCWATVEQLASTENYSLAIGPFGSDLKVEDYRDQGVPLVFVRNIRSGVFDGPDIHYVTPEKAHELRAHQVVGGDLLITKMGDPPGDACLYPETRPPAIITADCIKWALSPLLPMRLFFLHALNSNLVRIQVLGITKGVAQLKVSLARFKTVAIPLPPLTEQEQIVAEVERRLSIVSELETTVEASLKRAERLRQSILREAFAGRLVLQDPNDEPANVLLERIRQERKRAEQAEQKSQARLKGRENEQPLAPEAQSTLSITTEVSIPGAVKQAGLWDN